MVTTLPKDKFYFVAVVDQDGRKDTKPISKMFVDSYKEAISYCEIILSDGWEIDREKALGS